MSDSEPLRETSDRPWGRYVVLDDAEDHKVKRLIVQPGKRLSLQVHRFRSEHWFVVQGSGTVTLGDALLAIVPGCAIDIPAGTAHRVENTGATELVFIEVQHGESFGEDDIVRIEDDFGRHVS